MRLLLGAMRSWPASASALTLVLLATLVVDGCAKDGETAPPARGVFAPAPAGRQQGAEDTAPTATPANAAGCETLGTLVGNGLEASLDSATRRSVAVPLVSRPTATRVAVQGVGASADLSGKTIALGVAANVANDTCTHCLLISVGCAGDDCSNAEYYFPRSGTATFTAVASAAGQPFGGRFSDVILEHVTIDHATGATRAAGDARCLYVKDLAFDALVPAEGTITPPDDGGSGGGGGSTDEDGGSSTSSSSGGGGTGKGGGGGGNGSL
jgi:uncharacterized membrane protein YgcG